MSIDRGNSKHGPRLDEEMAQEVKAESHVDEWRELEPPGEDQPEPSWIPPGHHGLDTGDDLDPDRRDERARIGAHLPRDVYPADREKILRAARASQAPDEVTQALGRLPGDVTYPDPMELWKALGLHSDRG